MEIINIIIIISNNYYYHFSILFLFVLFSFLLINLTTGFLFVVYATPPDINPALNYPLISY